jgi:hypothetical protein
MRVRSAAAASSSLHGWGAKKAESIARRSVGVAAFGLTTRFAKCAMTTLYNPHSTSSLNFQPELDSGCLLAEMLVSVASN